MKRSRIKAVLLALLAMGVVATTMTACGSESTADNSSTVTSSKSSTSSKGSNSSTTSSKDTTSRVSAQKITVTLPDGTTAEGTYTGYLKDGVPNGTGEFLTEKEPGDTWKYSGTWVDGNFKGEGKSTKKTVADFYETLGITNGHNKFTLTSNAEKFLREHTDLFPATSVDQIISLTDTTLTYAHLDKDIDRYSNTLVKISGRVIDAKAEKSGGENITYVHVVTNSMDSFILFYKGDLDNIFKGDNVTFYGLPLSTTSFSNVSGGTTRAIIVAANLVLK